MKGTGLRSNWMLVEATAGPATEPNESPTLPFVIPSEAEGSAVPSTSPPRSRAKTNCHPESSGQVDARRKKRRHLARVRMTNTRRRTAFRPYPGVSTFQLRGGSYFNQGSSFVCCVLALYQGTTLVGPHRTNENWAFSPCLRLPDKEKPRG